MQNNWKEDIKPEETKQRAKKIVGARVGNWSEEIIIQCSHKTGGKRLAECARCRFIDVTPNRYRFIIWRPNQRKFSSFSITLTKWFNRHKKYVNKQHSVYQTYSTQPKRQRQRLIMPSLNFSVLLMNAAALIQWTSLTDKNILFRGNFRYTILIQKCVQMVIKRKSTTNFSHTYPTQYTTLTTLVNLKLSPSDDPIRSDIILF